MNENKSVTGDTGAQNGHRPRHVAGSIALALVSVSGVAMVLSPLHDRISTTTAALSLMLVVIVVAAQRGLAPALAASLAGMLAFNFFFLPPVRTFTIADPENWVALVAFLVTSAIVGQLFSLAKRRAEEAVDRQREIQGLYADLQEAFDRAARAEAERQAERMRNALLDAVTHELRTPLTGIKVSVTALLGDYADSRGDEANLSGEDRREMLSVIDEEADRLNRYIGNLVDLARIEAGRLPIKRSWNAPGEIAADSVERVRVRRSGRAIHLATAADTPTIFADGRALAEALFLLLDNAVKYSPSNAAIHLSVYAAAGGAVEFAVEDEGPGIAPELRERVFERFFRVENSGPESVVGTGMGLPIARGIVEGHGGTLRIEDRPGASGTRIVLRVPVGDDDPAESSMRDSASLESA
ncbi:MAG: DUF4118 domain-containing protein [Acidobacteria bacterium]|nr:DUF4118 domain-containing protein [Acidobacteriota bacterium]